MVSKIVKRTPTKSLKNRKSLPLRSERRRSPKKNATATAAAAALYACHRRLIKILHKLACITTPGKKKTPRRKSGYQILEKDPGSPLVRRPLFISGNDRIPLPPATVPEKKTVFLDLDETLVHSTANVPPEKYDFVVRPVIDGEKVEFYVLKRPFVDEFLRVLSENFEVVVFTAGIEEYASLVVDRLDWRKVIAHRLYRNSCRQIDGKFVKDLSEIGRDLDRVFIVDDNPNSYELQPDNAIPIKPFINDLGDDELKKLIHFFQGCYSDIGGDVRDAAVKGYFQAV